MTRKFVKRLNLVATNSTKEIFEIKLLLPFPVSCTFKIQGVEIIFNQITKTTKYLAFLFTRFYFADASNKIYLWYDQSNPRSVTTSHRGDSTQHNFAMTNLASHNSALSSVNQNPCTFERWKGRTHIS